MAAYKLTLNQEKCDSCGFCSTSESKHFEFYNGQVFLESGDDEKIIDNSRVIKRLKTLAASCPAKAIMFERIRN